MPHLAIDYSPSLEARVNVTAVCQAAYDAMIKSGVFPVAGIRVRAHRADICIVADDLPENDFLAMTLSVGAGRSKDVLAEAGSLVFDAVREVLSEPLSTPHFALSLEIRVMDPDLSWKDTPIHARLSGQTKD